MPTPAKRPAHRPSRRAAVVEAAIHLFASRSSESVTVAEIAKQAGMTSAAVYYHYASKDDILLEGLRDFGGQLVAQVRLLQRQVSRAELSVTRLPREVIAWVDLNRDAASVYFVGSAGLTLAVEAVRRDIQASLIAALATAGRAARPGAAAGEAAVVGVALLALLDSAVSAWLLQDESVATLGADAFLDETGRLAARIVGLPVPPAAHTR